MKSRYFKRIVFSAAMLLVAGVGGAQWMDWQDDDNMDRGGVPDWENNKRFQDDVFTFVRIQYSSGGRGGFGFRGRGGRGGAWRTDYPDSDLNLSFRLQQLTSLKVEPRPIYMRLTDDRLFDYPFIYIIEPGRLVFSEDEVQALRRYLLSGGFLMVDDFWGDYEWNNFYQQIKRVFPDREPSELPLDHDVFSCVYRLKEKPQVCGLRAAVQGRPWGVTWEDGHGGDCRTVHYKGLFDDDGRMMAIICHNTDLGDGWEEEGVSEWYFNEFAENKAYPMAINIIFYAMTH